MKIFISIASYQDPMLELTILNAYEKAKRPENLVFGVCDQSLEPLNLDTFKFNQQIKYHHVFPIESGGPCWARKEIQKNFKDEDYFLQIDSHMRFEEGWDEYLINYIKKIKSVNVSSHQLPIITCYPRAFEVIDFEAREFKLNNEVRTDAISYRKDSMFIKNNFCRQIGSIASEDIVHGYLIAAGCLFTTKDFIHQIPYDSDFYFYGEEISLMLRAFTRGFGIFHISALPIFHLYADHSNIKRKLHWDKEEDSKRKIKWHHREEKSIGKLNMLINSKVEGVYGLGKERTIKDYEYLSGVDLIGKVVVNEEKAFTAKFLSNIPWDKSPFMNQTDE